MKKPMIIAPLLVIAALSLTFAVADRLQERASRDRLSLYDPGTTNIVAN